MAVARAARWIAGFRLTSSNIKDEVKRKWGFVGSEPYGVPIDFDRAWGHKPLAGPKNTMGNRFCSHMHYSGSLQMVPSNWRPNSQIRSNIPYMDAWWENRDTGRKFCSMGDYTKYHDGPPRFVGNQLEWRVSKGQDQYPGLFPRYYLVSGSVKGSVMDEGTIYLEARLTFKATDGYYDRVEPKEFTLSDSISKSGRRSYSCSVTLNMSKTFTEKGVGERTFTFVFGASRTIMAEMPDVNPQVAWVEARGLIPSIFEQAVLANEKSRFSEQTLPDLAGKGFDHLQEVTMNSMAYARDLTHLRKDAKKLIKTLRKVRNPSTWPDLWLSYRFGFRLFYEDTKEILQAAKQYRKRTFKGSIRRTHSQISSSTQSPYGDTINLRSGLTIYSDEKSLSERGVMHAASSLDMLPSLSNMWDFVPYSFVVDWIVPVGDYLERLDNAAATWVYPIRTACHTVKAEMELKLPPNWGGSMKYVMFTRNNYSQAQLSRRVAQLPSGMLSGLSLKHGVDTLCLAVQRFKR